jgi:uncharacterized protein YyaL (SSP411 family)
MVFLMVQEKVNDTGKRYNHLKGEKSPYLIQHAENPVDWYPWGEEAFQKAKKENKPIFLSIGYSTCHWCHVMARESFEDEDMAEFINQVFVPVKVDREEHPDVDSTYMAACQIMTGRGGWPLTVFLTPDLKPFFAGTYFPKDDSELSVGLKSIVLKVKGIWEKNRKELLESAEEITDALNQLSSTSSGELLPESTLTRAYNVLTNSFDEHGGFGTSQKFPSPNLLLYLLHYFEHTGEQGALDMVEKTLRAMRMGGIWDHVGFGFHRYTVDPEWLVPHFEKMLYDQALLTLVYLEVYQATGKYEYRETAEKILEYVLRDMTSEQGGFFSAEDAESEGVEGKFYLWTQQEVKTILDVEEYKLFTRIYRVKERGNYLDDLTGLFTGKNILHLEKPLDETAEETDLKVEELKVKLDTIREKLFQEREKRVHPRKDDKVLTDWNGLMIAALARAGRVLNEKRYTEAAIKATEFIKGNLYQDGKLHHRYRDGEVKVEGYLEDHAFLVWGLIELYEATLDASWLEWAYQLNQVLLDKYLDEENGGFYLTSEDAEEVLTRKKDLNDSALPSGNGITLLNLQQLSSLLEDQELNEWALKQEKAFAPLVDQAPTGHIIFLIGIINRLGPFYEVVIAGEKDEVGTEKLLEIFNENYLPRAVYSLNSPDEEWLKSRVETFLEKKPVEGQVTAYVCKQGVCGLPITDPGELLAHLSK